MNLWAQAPVPHPSVEGKTWIDRVRVMSFCAVGDRIIAICLYDGVLHDFQLEDLQKVTDKI